MFAALETVFTPLQCVTTLRLLSLVTAEFNGFFHLQKVPKL